MENYAYVRVSSKDQNEDRQLIALQDTGVDFKEIYIDKQSGKDFNRDQYNTMLSSIGCGDILYIKSIDRLGRNYEEIQNQWRCLTKEKKVDIVVLDMPLLDTRREKSLLGTFIADIVLQLLSFIAENERQNIRQRQAEGIAAAKMRGVHFGRTPIPLTDSFSQAYNEYVSGIITVNTAAKKSGMSRATFYRKVKMVGTCL